MHAKRTLFGVGLLLILTIWLSGCADQRAPISTVLQNCLTIERIPDPERQLQAPLLLRVNVDIYSVDPRSGQTSLLLGSKTLLKLIDDLYVSPDYRRFVYTEILYFVKPKTVGERQTHRRIVLVQSNGQEREVYRSPIYPGWLLGWLDNERLILARSDLTFGAVTLLDPLTGQREDVLPTFSHFYPPLFYDTETGRAAYFLDPPRWFPIAYSPDMSRALLYLYDGSHPARDILWDTERQQIVWEEETSVRIGLRPQWSPDGRSVLVAMPYDREDDNNYGQELYTIDRNG